MDLLVIKDVATHETFKIKPTLNVAWVETRDGVRVRLHPVAIKTFVLKGTEFDGSTLRGTRRMKLL